jgi:FkbM family methyltransferase
MISIPDDIARSFIYVDCGARGEIHHPFLSAYPHAQYIGFEADAEESARVQANLQSGQRIFPVAVGRTNATLPFYVTKNPACSSFVEPDSGFFGQFLDSSDDLHILSTIDLPVVALDDYLPSAGVDTIDFIELDTQGSELDILEGAQNFLKCSVLGLRVEVEFAQIYKQQPLFSDIDPFIRSQGFMLFDLSRHRYRRKASPRELATNGQLLYGHAVYMKDYKNLSGPDAWIKTIKLIMISDFLGIRDYAFEMIEHLMKQSQQSEIEILAEIRREYEKFAAKRTRMFPLIQFADKIGLRRFLESIVRKCAIVVDAYRIETTIGRKSWSD